MKMPWSSALIFIVGITLCVGVEAIIGTIDDGEREFYKGTVLATVVFAAITSLEKWQRRREVRKMNAMLRKEQP